MKGGTKLGSEREDAWMVQEHRLINAQVSALHNDAKDKMPEWVLLASRTAKALIKEANYSTDKKTAETPAQKRPQQTKAQQSRAEKRRAESRAGNV